MPSFWQERPRHEVRCGPFVALSHRSTSTGFCEIQVGLHSTLTKGPSSSSPARMESDVSHSLNHASCLCSRITNRGLQNKATIRPTSSQLQMLATQERPRLNSPISLTNPSVHGWQRFEPKPHRFTEKAFVRLHPTPIAIRLPCGSSTVEQPTRMLHAFWVTPWPPLKRTTRNLESHHRSERRGRQLMLAQRCRQRMERLSQNGWIGSEKFGLQITTRSASTLRGVRTPDWWRTYQDSNPGFRLRRPK